MGGEGRGLKKMTLRDTYVLNDPLGNFKQRLDISGYLYSLTIFKLLF